jgi:hypothetical protein
MEETKTIEEPRKAVDSTNAAYGEVLAASRKATTAAYCAHADVKAVYTALADAISG